MSHRSTLEPKTDLTGKVAVITGVASDVGLALALHAADRGMKVALCDENEYLLAAALEKVRMKDVGAIAIPSDRFDSPTFRELARRTAAELGPPWLVCNNPGVNIEVTLWGLINGVQVFTPGMVERDQGHIVNIAAAEVFGTRGAAPDAAITHAIVGLSESLYRELDSRGSQVGVTLVCPALGNTSIAGAAECLNSALPTRGRVAPNSLSPEEVAKQIFSAVDARSFWFRPLTFGLRELSGPGRGAGAWADTAAKSQIRRPRKQSGAARKAEENCGFGVAKHGTHLWKSQKVNACTQFSEAVKVMSAAKAPKQQE
jgi:NAD(P)-dependent dehydrogenase (short-subunit alcohol dehydrogenase family)